MLERADIEPSDVTVVLPCRNESGALPAVLGAVPPGYQVLVVDNASSDETADVARRGGADVVYAAVPGYGAAVDAGVRAATTAVVCVLDGDGSMDPGDLPTLLRALASGADLAVGRRIPTRHSGWPLHTRVGNAVVASLLRRRYGLPVHDVAAMRAVRRSALLDLAVTDRRSGYPLELLVRAARAQWRIVECDVTYRRRTAGRSKVSGSVRGTVGAIRDFWRVIG